MATPLFVCLPESYGRYIRLERQRWGLRQVDLAELAGIPQTYVSAAERNLYIPWWAKEALQQTLEKLAAKDEHANAEDE